MYPSSTAVAKFIQANQGNADFRVEAFLTLWQAISVMRAYLKEHILTHEGCGISCERRMRIEAKRAELESTFPIKIDADGNEVIA
jgi:hypothetical protein